VPLGMHFYPPRYRMEPLLPPSGGSGVSRPWPATSITPRPQGVWYHPQTGQRFMDGKPTGPEREPNPAFVRREDLETGAPVDPRWHPKAADRTGRNYGLLITVLSVLVAAIVIVLVCSLAIAGVVGLWAFIVETWPHLSPPTLGTV
jgi:hypothetical protein